MSSHHPDTQEDPPETAEQHESELRHAVLGPILTWAVCGACVLVFLASSSVEEPKTWESLAAIGYFPAMWIWEGRYWGLWTSVFVHLSLLHLAFNLSWLWSLGGSLEIAAGRLLWVALFILSAGVSSSAELAVADDTGIGASGVVYAFFGFAWATRRNLPVFETVVGRLNLLVLLGWLVLCPILSYFDILNVGNAAHFAGLLTGFLAGHAYYCAGRKSLSRAALAILIVLAIVPLFWAPWSSLWIQSNVTRAFEDERYMDAIDDLNTLLERDPRDAWALYNRGVAFDRLGMEREAARDIGLAVSLDPNNEAFATGAADPNIAASTVPP